MGEKYYKQVLMSLYKKKLQIYLVSMKGLEAKSFSPLGRLLATDNREIQRRCGSNHQRATQAIKFR